jgi:hypothetical protein
MRAPPLLGLAIPALLVGAGLCTLALTARAGDAPAAPRKIESGFLRGLAGDWDTEMTAGKLGTNRGNARWELILQGTALEEDYSSAITDAAGNSTGWRVKVIARETAAGKAEAWMFDTRREQPIHFAGTVSDAGLDVSAETPEAKFRVTCERKGETREWKMWRDGAVVNVETHRPSAR